MLDIHTLNWTYRYFCLYIHHCWGRSSVIALGPCCTWAESSACCKGDLLLESFPLGHISMQVAFTECLVLSELWALWNLLKQSLFKTLVDIRLIWHPLETWVGDRCWIKQAEADMQKSRRLSVRMLGVFKGIWVLPQFEGYWMQLYGRKLCWISPAVEPAYLFYITCSR